MWLQRFHFEAKDLGMIPESERVFVVFLGHISNEINILQKLIMMAHNLDDDPPPAEMQGRTAQTMCLLRVLVGKLNEAHRTIKERYLDPGLHAKIKHKFDEEGRRSLDAFVDYFSAPNNDINVMRKKIAFHNDWEFARQHLRSIPNNASLFIYSDGTEGNTLSQFADVGVAAAMSNHVKPNNFPAGLDTITDDAIHLARCVLRFNSECLGILIGRYVNLRQDQVELHPRASVEDARIPFFMLPGQSAGHGER